MSICSAGHAKLASPTSTLRAKFGDGYAPGGYSALSDPNTRDLASGFTDSTDGPDLEDVLYSHDK